MRRPTDRWLLVAVLAPVVGTLHCDDSTEPPGGDGGTCEDPTGPGVEHSDTITADETWRAADNPHIVTFGIEVAAGATLTVEPCAIVRVRAGYTIGVEGNLVAEGLADRPIQFIADDAAEPWGSLQVLAPGTIRLAYTSVDDAGADTTNAYGAIEARGDQLLPAQEVLSVDHVTVRRSANFGVSLRAGAAFSADARDLTVTGSAQAAMRILPRLATNIPTGTYTGNAKDAIVVETESYGDVSLEDVTFHDRGVPYQIGGDTTAGDMVVGTGDHVVTLTLEPGVTMEFIAAAVLEIDKGSRGEPATGRLVATGTSDAPIVLTSAEATPAAGDWRGVVFANLPDPGNQMDWVTIQYAGGPSFANSFHCQPDGSLSGDEDAALAVYGQTDAFLTNSTIADSAGLGIDLAYTGAFVDFLPTNTFTNIATCKTSYPREAPDGGCPASVPCP